jgi:ribonuclease PH
MDQIGERTLIVDCDVLQADGGTRTAAITGAYVALYQAFQTLVERKTIPLVPFNSAVAATSVGILNDEILLDLCYEEDFQAQSDFNVVMTDEGEFVEVQGTAEGQTFSKIRLDQVLSLAETGINSLFKVQQNAIDSL